MYIYTYRGCWGSLVDCGPRPAGDIATSLGMILMILMYYYYNYYFYYYYYYNYYFYYYYYYYYHQ